MSDQNGSTERHANIYDVANLAGVSHMTVSRVLNGHPNIRESTRERVEAAISELAYTRSSAARALVTRRVMRIGVLVDRAVEYGPSSTLRGIERAAREDGYAVITTSGDDGPERGIERLHAQGVDAICIISPRVSSLPMVSRSLRVPSVIIQTEPIPGSHCVAVDQLAGARAAVEHLQGLGHERILHLAGPDDWFESRLRREVWAQAVGGRLAAELAAEGDWGADSGYTVGRSDPRIDEVTAVFAANDQMALGLMHGLADRGLRVPDDISVVGFDDLPESAHYLPPLTTVRQDFDLVGARAVEMLLHLVRTEREAAPGPRTAVLVEPELVVRRSTAAR